MTTREQQGGEERYLHLDGLRGVAAMIVVLCHFMLGFQMAFTSGDPAHGAWAAATGLSHTPLILFWNPEFGVCVFFVLSGFVLSAASGRGPDDRPLLRLAAVVVRRWIRLAGPILGSSVLIWAAVQAGWLRNLEVAASNRSNWLGMHFTWLGWETNSFPIMVWQSLFDIFARSLHWWNFALWTMPVEFWGSVALFAGYAALRRMPRWMRVAPLLVLLVVLLHSHFVGFAMGALTWECRGALLRRGRTLWWLGAAAALAAFLVGGTPWDMGGTPYLRAYALLAPYVAEPVLLAHRAGAWLMVVAAIAWPPLRGLLSLRPVLALGRVSFMVYLLHVPLLCTLTSAVVLMLAPGWGYDVACAVALVATIAVLLPMAAVMTRLVDAPSITLSRRVEAGLLRGLPLGRPRQA